MYIKYVRERARVFQKKKKNRNPGDHRTKYFVAHSFFRKIFYSVSRRFQFLVHEDLLGSSNIHCSSPLNIQFNFQINVEW